MELDIAYYLRCTPTSCCAANKQHNPTRIASYCSVHLLIQEERAMLSERDMQRICELLARFSQYTQAFEREEAEHDNQQQSEKTETMGTVSERMADTRATHRRPRRVVSK